IISRISPDKSYKVYCPQCWWSDKWDPLDYGKDYDFSMAFFEQFRELMLATPHVGTFNSNNINSEWVNHETDDKNCYLNFGGDFNEDCAYSTFNFYSKDSYDLYWVNKSEFCYEDIDSENCNKVFFSRNTRDSLSSAFLLDCVNCQNCLGCVGLRNKSFCIFNQPYTKEEYEKQKAEFRLETFSGLSAFQKKFRDFILTRPHRYAEIVKAVNSTGHNIHNAKNCQNCFDVYQDTENGKDLLICGWGLRDARNADHAGHNSELVYNSSGVAGSNKIKLSFYIFSGLDTCYSFNCHNNNRNLFGCVGLRNKQYCILNKQYTKEEYETLIPKIIEQMNTLPYVDKKGRAYKYGEFFPAELSPFCYNETIAQEYFPLTKEQAIEQGYSWKDSEPRNYQIDLTIDQLPDNIKDVKDDIVGKVIECQHKGTYNEQCTEAFRIIEPELAFYRRMNLPLPRLCPNCRHYQRLKQRNPLKLWKRNCQAPGCSNTFETSYAPDRPEIVYCEQCYLKEVV
ncbi:MAG: hypothetical protein AAB740_02890, partial [Patescibacteria group bacterium]